MKSKYPTMIEIQNEAAKIFPMSPFFWYIEAIYAPLYNEDGSDTGETFRGKRKVAQHWLI